MRSFSDCAAARFTCANYGAEPVLPWARCGRTLELVRSSLVTRRKDGNRVYYSASAGHPLADDLRQIVLKTAGLTDVLANALDNEAIRCALVFGSVAAGTARESDIDLLVIGDIGLRKVTELLAGVGDRLGREINSHVLSPAEFASRVASKEHFVTSVMRSKKIFVKGSQRELAQWQNNGWLRPHTTSREEIENLLGIARGGGTCRTPAARRFPTIGDSASHTTPL